jgi:hypothetical protein
MCEINRSTCPSIPPSLSLSLNKTGGMKVSDMFELFSILIQLITQGNFIAENINDLSHGYMALTRNILS